MSDGAIRLNHSGISSQLRVSVKVYSIEYDRLGELSNRY